MKTLNEVRDTLRSINGDGFGTVQERDRAIELYIALTVDCSSEEEFLAKVPEFSDLLWDWEGYLECIWFDQAARAKYAQAYNI